MTAATFKAARDFLLAHRTDYATAYRDFRWPELDRFNWALDWFDRELARGDTAHQPALVIVGEGAARLTFAELSDALTESPTACAPSESNAATASCSCSATSSRSGKSCSPR